jgi:hypothetical protein
MFVSMDVTFRESEPFYGEQTDLSLLFAELDQLHSVQDGHEGEKVVSHTKGDSMGTKPDGDVQVEVQPIVGTIRLILPRFQLLFRIGGHRISKCTLDGNHMCRGSRKVVM